MKLKIKNAEIDVIANALKDLDGVYETIVIQQPDGSTRPERKLVKNYKYASGRLKFNVAKNLRLLNEASETVLSALRLIIEECKPTPDALKLEGEAFARYDRKRVQILEMPIEIDGMLPINFSELQMEANNIPALALAGLGDLLVDDAPGV